MRWLWSLIFLLCTAVVSAQDFNVYVPEDNIWPESPRARAIREISMPTAASLTGACRFSVPLYTLTVENVSIPVSLEYQTNGIRVEDDPQPIGYGWVLQPSLRVSRQIMGRPDGLFKFVGEVPVHTFENEYDLAFGCVNNFDARGSNPDTVNLYDSQHDIFTFHLLDKSLTMLFHKGAFHGIECDEYKIETDTIISYIKVTDPKGVIYDFSIKGECIDEPFYQTEWMLSSLTLPSGDKITFKWNSLGHMARGKAKFGPVTLRMGWRVPQFWEMSDPRSAKYTKEHSYMNECDLEEIRFPGGIMRFVYGTVSEYKVLSKVEVENDIENIFTASLLHEYGAQLLSGIDLGKDGCYKFEYDPQRFTNICSDWWGFYNGREFDALSSPALTLKYCEDYRGYDIDCDGADFSVDTVKMRANILVQATVPTGGTIKWNYEVHRFPPQGSPGKWIDKHIDVPVLSYGGGLRVKSIEMRESEGTQARTKKYIYGTGGNGLAHVEALPLLHTFISDSRIIQLRYYMEGDPDIYDDDRYVVISGHSDYLTGMTGCTPLWYPEVKEIDEEGMTINFYDNLIEPNQVIREWGRAYPRLITTAFSNGPQLISTEIYKGNNEEVSMVQKIENKYNVIKAADRDYYANTSVIRDLVQLDYSVSAPDWGKVNRVGLTYPAWQMQAKYGEIPCGADVAERDYFDWYIIRPFSIAMHSERLISTTVTTFSESGALTRTTSYTYSAGTGLPLSSTLTDGFSTVETEYLYTDGQKPEIAEAMRERNVLGLVTGLRQKFNGSWRSYTGEMIHCGGSVFRAARIIQQTSESDPWCDAHYTYDNHGNLLTRKGNDSIITSWTWDSNNRHPLSQTIAGTLTSTARWKSLVGVTALTDPSGISHTYTYDSRGNLASTSVEGRLLEENIYSINPVTGNYATTRSYVSTDRYAESTVRYDGLGRPWGFFNILDGCSYGELTEYDAMGHPAMKWMPVPISSVAGTPDDLKSEASTYYDDPAPFETYCYEPSTRRMLLSTTKSGEAWHTGDHHVTSSVRAYGPDDRVMLKLRPSNDSIVSLGKYSYGELEVTQDIDEDGMSITTYTDLRGNIVATLHDSYIVQYVYDDFNRLRYILPTGLTQSRHRDNTLVQRTAYWYDYDSRGRCIRKHIPTRAESEYIYDPAGRLAAEHPETTSDPNLWLLYGYDYAGRRVVVIETSLGRGDAEDFASSVRTATLDAPTVDEWNRGGYTFSPEWSMPGNARSACYYDNYDFISNRGLDEAFRFDAKEFRPDIDTDSSSGAVLIDIPVQGSSNGKLTGVYTGSGYEVYYYDNFGRELQRYATGFNRGRRTTFYTYNGSTKTIYHTYDGSVWLPGRRIDYTYDNAGRLIEVKTSEERRPIAWSADSVKSPFKAPALTLGYPAARIKNRYNRIGLVDSLLLGNAASRKFDYDIHGWKTNTVTRTATVTINETLHYHDGMTPRYNGFISAITRNSGRYDYTYDGRGFLKHASFTASSLNQGADFSASYTYTVHGNLTGVKRYGVIDRLPDGTETYGILDNLRITYTGHLANRVRGTGQGAVFSERTGFGNAVDADLEYDDAGRLVSDPSRGIFLIEYDNQDHPVRTYFDDGHVHYENWDGFGNHISTTFYEAVGTVVTGQRPKRMRMTARRSYTGDGHIIVNDTLEMAVFGGGYFDRLGNEHYYITDYQNNTVAVIDGSGNMEQATDYYPYGEPWRRPTGQPFLFGGKEYLGTDGRAELYFGARQYITGFPRFSTPDILAEKTPHISPTAYCAANPIMLIDPSGCDAIYFPESDEELICAGTTGTDDPNVYIVSKKKGYELRKQAKETKDGILPSMEISNDVAIIPKRMFLEEITGIVTEANENQREEGGHKFIGFEQIIRWYSGDSYKEGNIKNSIKAFNYDRKVLPLGLSATYDNTEFYFHIHPYIKGTGFGTANPSPGDKQKDNVYRDYERPYNGTTFVVGGRKSDVTFYYRNSIIAKILLDKLINVAK
ncbi:MAG: hypothetical protein NC405_07015 [Odoribacter sp.]|nr:hypothetical protein [Odoribacter sp.]